MSVCERRAAVPFDVLTGSLLNRAVRACVLPALIGVVLAGCGAGPAEQDAAARRDSDDGYRGIVLSEAIPRPDFRLRNTRGEVFDFRAETDGYLTFLFFGYTHCPDVCPVHMANLAAVLGDLSYERRSRIKIVFVTADPVRDTADRLRKWLDAFDRRFIGLRGDLEAVNDILVDLNLARVVYNDSAEDGSYRVGHPAQIIAFSADGPARVVYPFGTRQVDWAHDLPLLLAAAHGETPPSAGNARDELDRPRASGSRAR